LKYSFFDAESPKETQFYYLRFSLVHGSQDIQSLVQVNNVLMIFAPRKQRLFKGQMDGVASSL
jgi:hypothetical protein